MDKIEEMQRIIEMKEFELMKERETIVFLKDLVFKLIGGRMSE